MLAERYYLIRCDLCNAEEVKAPTRAVASARARTWGWLRMPTEGGMRDLGPKCVKERLEER